MCKQFLVFMLLAAFAAQTFNRAVIVCNYYSNTAAYAKNCENKAKPMLHCNGRCQMMKKLKKEANKDQQNPERRSDNKNEVLFCSKYTGGLNNPSGIFVSSYPEMNNRFTKDIPADFFHPPGA